ncbi:unannotated protein [freshwater metagenome]|uniref:Unannotated protein n=1 Tax=freshwater metagenome TaxID=449393 RepID=A0A6J7ES46_9ZZZZ
MILERHVEVLRAGLGKHVLPVVARLGNLVECLRRRHVHDVQGHVASHLGQHDCPVCRLTLEVRWAGDRVILRVAFTACECLGNEHVDGDPVLGVHHDEGAALRRRLHRLEDLAVVAVEHARIGHEQLEARDALVLGEVLHRLERLVVDTADDLAERVVDGAVLGRLVVPLGQRVVHVPAVPLHGHVTDGGDPAPGRCARAGLEGVGRLGAAERQLEVGVNIHTAGDHVLAGCVDDTVAVSGSGSWQVHRDDNLAVDEHVLRDLAGRADDGAVLDDDSHVVSLWGRWLDQAVAGGPGRDRSAEVALP